MTDIMTAVVIVLVGAFAFALGFFTGWQRACAWAYKEAESLIRKAREDAQ